jgi:hypothetical protein
MQIAESATWRRRAPWAVMALAMLAATVVAHPTTVDSPQASFAAENDAAMTRMMADMHVAPSGDIDRDFAVMMIPHHQGAIDMALAELRYGRNEQLRRIAQEIIVEQLQEIDAMKLALDQPLSPSAPVPTQALPMSSGMPMSNHASHASHAHQD